MSSVFSSADESALLWDGGVLQLALRAPLSHGDSWVRKDLGHLVLPCFKQFKHHRPPPDVSWQRLLSVPTVMAACPEVLIRMTARPALARLSLVCTWLMAQLSPPLVSRPSSATAAAVVAGSFPC